MHQHRDSVDFNALVDIISNVAGMMVLMACIALLMRQQATDPPDSLRAAMKPISFPLAYIPDKRSLTLCVKDNRLYLLPDQAALREVSRRTEQGLTVDWIEVEENGVNARIELAPTFTGFRFQFRLLPDGGIDVANRQLVVETLERVLRDFPPSAFFYDIHTWPESFVAFREIREWLHEHDAEVGWKPKRRPTADDAYQPNYDVAYSVGEYDENLATIKAQ